MLILYDNIQTNERAQAVVRLEWKILMSCSANPMFISDRVPQSSLHHYPEPVNRFIDWRNVYSQLCSLTNLKIIPLHFACSLWVSLLICYLFTTSQFVEIGLYLSQHRLASFPRRINWRVFSIVFSISGRI